MPESTVSILIREAQNSLVLQRRVVLQLLADADRETDLDEVGRTLHMLFHYLCDRGHAVLALVTNGLDWDAEIILRTYYECAAKVLFITLSPSSEQAAIVWEFWTPLGEAVDRKTARKAGYAEEVFSETDQDNRDVFRLLRHPRMIRDTLKLTKADRRRLEHKWSFSELIETLSRFEVDNQQLTEIRSLLHIYGMASHLVHADCNAMDLMSDRALRSSEQLQQLQDGHVARIITDMVSLGAFCADLIGKHLDVPNETLSGLRQQMKVVVATAETITESFYASQRSFYDDMLKPSSASD